ncbi:heat shock 70 kDa protein 12A-like [Alosa pseudoharengus]|uniref:heat shock 70 kDa protein 12A-like n=1 Tax=Alosa pseudoharengus TaxID=34774 RepID=UPI003F8BB8B1
MSASFFIIAIDFGTAYSGYAFSVRPKNEEIPDIRVPFWTQGTGLKSVKTHTCILFDQHGKFVSFGFEAKMKYTKMPSNEARTHFFFENFKMNLYNAALDRDMTIQTCDGKSMSAVKVFSESLRFLKDHALKKIAEHTTGKTFIASDATWVLTVPAIWGASAKQFMREAAKQAGIIDKFDSKTLIIALEPEAASVWCKQLPKQGFLGVGQQGNVLEQSTGTQYIVVDCGGGTIDITAHEVRDRGYLKELHKASGNNLGGQMIDSKFESLLIEIFTDDVWAEFQKREPGELLKRKTEFSFVKCGDEEEDDDDALITFPISLMAIAEEHGEQKISEFFNYVEGADWQNGYIKISASKMRSLFEESLKGISNNINQVLSHNDTNIQYILLVGGYAQCKLLRKHITKEFGRRCTVLCPVEPQVAILKGAVLFGLKPKVIESRVSTRTYGIMESEHFNPSRHSRSKVHYNKDRIEYCNVFKRLVKVGESIGCDEVREHYLTPVNSDQREMVFQFYCTEKEDAIEVDEDGMKNIGNFTVPMPDISKGMNRCVRLEVRFGNTEMQATATDMESMQTESVTLDFLCH